MLLIKTRNIKPDRTPLAEKQACKAQNTELQTLKKFTQKSITEILKKIQKYKIKKLPEKLQMYAPTKGSHFWHLWHFGKLPSR